MKNLRHAFYVEKNSIFFIGVGTIAGYVVEYFAQSNIPKLLEKRGWILN